jgi:DNA polymerase-3 subunit alpha
MSTPQFVHLHLHTEYSLVDGLIDVKPLMQKLAQMGMPAVALTDQCNLFALVKFYRAAVAAGVKPIIGAELWIGNTPQDNQPSRLVLLCQNAQGYKNLTCLITRAYLEGQQTVVPLIQKSWLHSEATAGLIALSGARQGNIGQALLANQRPLAETLAAEWAALFPDRFYIELQRTGREHEGFYVQSALEIARSKGLPVVATNDVRFLNADDFEAHEARVCIHDGMVLQDSRRPQHYSEQQYLRSEAEMLQLFSDIPEALTNSVEIAKRCNLELKLGTSFLPNFPVPAGMTVDEFFRREACQGLTDRLNKTNITEREQHDARLELEINVIQKMGFTGYFLIVADFIRWAKSQKIPVGPGRGSGAGSLVAYALGITDLDPIIHDLLFERFLNPERVSMPDFDIDFCMEGRDRVIDYVAQKYGRDSVAQIITYGTMAARAVIRDVGRVLGHPYGFVDKLAKLIPFELGMTLEKALQDEPLLLQRYRAEEEVKTLIDLSKKLEGVPRNAGKHAGGVVIAPSVLTDFTPLYCEPGGENRVTQLDKNDVEDVGLVKFDFLGLRTLTIMDWAVQTINAQRAQQGEPLLDLNQLPLDDPDAYELLKSCQTTAVFQLESRGIKELIHRLQPNCFDDIVALVALYRPGPLQSGMVDDFINRKHGRATVEYLHPLLEPILRPTYGVIVYQEQVMQIAQTLAGYTLGGADLLRRAMGKKKPEEMAKQRAIFLNGADQRGIDAKAANQIFDLMEMFADYGFNKSHSAAYAVLSYQTAWLKAHYPAEFMAAVLSSDMDHTDKLVRFLEDAQRMGLTILPPDINQGQCAFTVSPDGEIIYGLGAIKGVGAAAIEGVIQERAAKGAFKNIFDLCQRVDTRKVNRKVLEALIQSGAMDDFNVGKNDALYNEPIYQRRATLMASLDAAIKTAEQVSRAKDAGQSDLFGSVMAADAPVVHAHVMAAPWSELQRLRGEKEVLGWYVSGHPIARFVDELTHFTKPLVALKPARDKTVTVAGYITSMRVVQTKSGGRIAFLTLDDRSARIDLGVFSDSYDNCRHLLVKDQLIVVDGEVGVDDYTEQNKLTAQRVYDIDEARQNHARYLLLDLHQKQLDPQFLTKLQQTFTPFLGGLCPVVISYQHASAVAHVQLGEEWRIKPQQALLESLRELVDARFEYRDLKH